MHLWRLLGDSLLDCSNLVWRAVLNYCHLDVSAFFHIVFVCGLMGMSVFIVMVIILWSEFLFVYSCER